MPLNVAIVGAGYVGETARGRETGDGRQAKECLVPSDSPFWV